MPIRRKLEEAVPTLLRLVDEVKPILVRLIVIVDPILGDEVERSKTLPDSSDEGYLGLLKKIKEFFDNQREDLFGEPNRREEDELRKEDELLKSLTALGKEIDKYYNNTGTDPGKEEGLPHKLLRVVDEVEPIQRRLVESKTRDPGASGSSNEGLEKIKDNLKKLEEIKNHLTLLKEIEDFFDKERTDLFQDLKRREDELLKNFTALEEHIDDSKYSIIDDGGRDSPAHPPMKRSISRKFESIKEDVSGFQRLELENSKGGQKNSESEAPAREISEKWCELKVESEILKSPAMSRLRWNYDDIIDHKMLIAVKDIEHHKILIHLKDKDESKEYKGHKEQTILACNIQLCLLCFSVFPAKSVIKKRPLIYWWLGEGLIGDTEEGERICWELIRKGFLTAEYKPHKKGQDKNPTVDSFTMHPWNLRMLISVAKTAELFDFDDDTGLPADHGTRSRRRCLVKQRNRREKDPGNGEDPKQGRTEQHQNNSSNMVTLFNVNEQYLNIDLKWFSEQNKLVVLQLGRWQDSAKHHIEVENEEFLKALGTMKHLKYLSLQGISRITAIPSSIRKLVNLEILDLRACHNLEKLPSDISSLKKLKYLDISECHLLESMPKGLEKLTSLQVLKGFVVTTSKHSPCKLENLAGKLDQLRKLSIYIRNEDRKEDLTQLKDLTELNKFKSVRILSITWGGAQDSTKHSTETKPASTEKKPAATEKKPSMTKRTSAEKVSLPPELQKLNLWCIPEECPGWLNPGKLQSLRKLYIRGGKLVQFKENVNYKWRVQILRLKYLHNFKKEEKDLRQHFPYLVYLEIENKAKDEHGAAAARSDHH